MSSKGRWETAIGSALLAKAVLLCVEMGVYRHFLEKFTREASNPLDFVIMIS